MILLLFLFLDIAFNNELSILYPGEVMKSIQEQDNQCAKYQKEIVLIDEQFDGEIVHITQNPFNLRYDVYYILQVYKGAKNYYSIIEVTLISFNRMKMNTLIKIYSAYCQNISFNYPSGIVIPCKTSSKWTIFVYQIEMNKLQSYDLSRVFQEDINKIFVVPSQTYIYLQGKQTVYKFSYIQNRVENIYYLNCTIEAGSIHRQFIGFICKNTIIIIQYSNLIQHKHNHTNITQIHFISSQQYLLISGGILVECLDKCEQIDYDVDSFYDTNTLSRFVYQKKNQIIINSSNTIFTYFQIEKTSYYYNFKSNLLLLYSGQSLKIVAMVKSPFYLMHSKCMIISNDSQVDYQLLENQNQIIRNQFLSFPKLNKLSQVNSFQILNYWIGINLQYNIEQIDNQDLIATSYKVEILYKMSNYQGYGLFVKDGIVMVLNDQSIQQFSLNKQLAPKTFFTSQQLKFRQDYLNYDQGSLTLQLINNGRIQVYKQTHDKYELIYDDGLTRMFINSIIIIYENQQSKLVISQKFEQGYSHQYLINYFGVKIEQIYYDQYAEQIVVLEKQQLKFFTYYNGLWQVNSIDLNENFISCYFYKDTMILVYSQYLYKYQRIQDHVFLQIGMIDIQNNSITKESIIIQEELKYLYIQNGRQLLIFNIELTIKYSLIHITDVLEDSYIIAAYQNWVWFQQGSNIIVFKLQPSIEIKLNYLNNFNNLNLSIRICAYNNYEKQCEILKNKIMQSYYTIRQKLQNIRYTQKQLDIHEIFDGLVEKLWSNKYELLRTKDRVNYKSIKLNNQLLYAQIHLDKLYIFSYTEVKVFDILDLKLLNIIQFNQSSRFYALKNESIIQFGKSQIQIAKCIYCEVEVLINQYQYTENSIRTFDQFIIIFVDKKFDIYDCNQNSQPTLSINIQSIISYDIYQDIIVYIDNQYQLFILNQKSYNLSEFFRNNDIMPDMAKLLDIELHVLNSKIDVLLVVNGEGIYIIRFSDKSYLKTILCISQKYFVHKLQVMLERDLINVAVHLGTKFAIYQFSQQDINGQNYIFPKKYMDLNQPFQHVSWFYGIVNGKQYLIHANNLNIVAIEFNLETIITAEIQFNEELTHFNLSNSNQQVQMQVQLIEQTDLYPILDFSIIILLIIYITLRRRIFIQGSQ